jgi:hypothetical protein
MQDTRFRENPFHVLGLPPEATRGELERQGQKLLGQLELGVASAKSYQTPLGIEERTPERVREALATLRDGAARLRAELWAKALVTYGETKVEHEHLTDQETQSPPDCFAEAFRSAGLRP